METVETLILGGGLSGLAFAYYNDSDNVALVEQNDHPGGKLRTIHKDGFTWDHAGHFLYFYSEEIQQTITEVVQDSLLEHQMRSHILFDGNLIDYPFYENIHQLSRDDFIDCLHDLYNRPDPDGSFYSELESKFGTAICEKFFWPYNSKLYSCNLNKLSGKHMGKHFSDPMFEDVLSSMAEQEQPEATFYYPANGIYSVIDGLSNQLAPGVVRTGEQVIDVDITRKEVKTTQTTYRYEKLVSTIPLDTFVSLEDELEEGMLKANKILVLNVGFDRETDVKSHWIYIPDKNINFHRIGFYNNIFDEERMSLFIEIGFNQSNKIDIEAEYEEALQHLEELGFIDKHQPISKSTVVMNRGYCYITPSSVDYVNQIRTKLQENDVFLAGRYAEWKYTNIEETIARSKELANSI